MSRNAKLIAGIIIGSLLLFAYVVPQAVNRVSDSLPEAVGKYVGHVPTVPFRLGLDLVGGAHLVYQADFAAVGEGVDQADAMEGIRDVVERRVNYFGVAEPVVQIEGRDRLIVEIAGVTDVNEAIKLIGETPFLDFKELIEGSGGEATTFELEDGTVIDNPLADFQSTGLTGKDVRRAQILFDPQTNQPEVSLELTEEGAQKFADITRRNLGKPVAIFLDGQPISVPTVQSEITDGNAVITGQFTAAEARQLATRLNSGALPVPIKLISQQTIGASLGHESLNDSLRAGLWGLILVGVFMVAFYRLPGLTSLVALGIYLLITLAVYKFLPVTLTLAGIAGFILSLGMALDANVLIFARMKEELSSGRSLAAALAEGFRRSWPSIRDSHVTVFISAFVLYAFTSSIVRGFALTLGIGVVLSLFTSIVVTRSFLRALAAGRLGQYRWLFS